MFNKLFTIALILVSVIASEAKTVIAAEFKLDARFKDADGDLVADAPADPKESIRRLIFAYTPVEDPAVYAKVWDSFIKHLEKTTGKRVQFFPVQSNAAQIEAMRAGRLHVAGFNTGATPLAVNCAGFVPFTLMSTKDGTYGYKMEIITYPGSGIDKPEDIKGKKMALQRRDLQSGYKAPAAILRDKFKLEGKGLRGRFLRQARQLDPRRRQQGLPGCRRRQLGAEAHDRARRAQGRAGEDDLRLRQLPFDRLRHVYNLKPELARKVEEAFFTFPWEGSALSTSSRTTIRQVDHFLKITYKQHWQVVRDVDQAMNVSYACK